MADFAARRAPQQVELRFTLPTGNANGPGPIDLDRVEIYAVTVAAGSMPPPNRDVLTKARIVGTIRVKPAPEEGAPAPPPDAADKRPSPGDRVTFVDELTQAKLTPIPVVPAPKADAKTAASGAATPPAEAAAPTGAAPTGATAPGATPPTGAPGADPATGAPPAQGAAPAPGTGAVPGLPPIPATLQHLTRIYVVRGLTRSGRPGPPTTRAMVPLESAVAAPTAVAAQMPTEKGVAIDWTPPVAEPGGAPIRFNVYRNLPTAAAAAAPLNKEPLGSPAFEIANEEFGKEHCYVVRSIQTTQNVTVESDPSAPACVTPLDKFAPVPPKNLRAVAEEGAVSLVWDPNTEADLGGYLVLRGDAAGGAMEPITKEPIKDTTYRDATVASGTRYVYAVVAVDSAPTRNSSPPSAQEAVTAR